MKKIILDFLRRGLIACGIGPLVLAVLYVIMQNRTGVQTLTVNEVCVGIVSLAALAFIAGGMNAVYQIERLPLMLAVLIHGAVLYVSYLVTYLVNGWLQQGVVPLLVFSGIFVVGYLMIWGVIAFLVQRRTARLNEILLQKQESAEE